MVDDNDLAHYRQPLLEIAAAAIDHGLSYDTPPVVNLQAYPASLGGPQANFVTLMQDGELRGCVGALEAHRPLATDVGHNAFAAAFRDPRFQPVSLPERYALTASIALLSAPEPLTADSEADLVACLRPGVDGLILEAGPCRSTFLPSVWEQLPEPALFVRQLKQKAGLPADYWSTHMHISRYTTACLSGALPRP